MAWYVGGWSGLSRSICGKVGKSGFGFFSTGEAVTAGVDASGLTAIVTGGSSGIGAETVRVLALRGAHVIIGARNLDAAGIVKDDILKEIPTARIDAIKLDLSSLDSVKQFALQFLATGRPLHVLINNAGVFMCPFELTVDGIESTFAVNHVGHFYLTQLLLERMKTTARESGIEGRIVNLSSTMHNWVYKGGIRFDKINQEQGYDRARAYGQSKLANVLHSKELARRLKGEGANVTANSVHPGYIYTNIFRHVRLQMAMGKTLCFFLWKTIPQGAATTLYVALHPAMKGESGKYYSDCNAEDVSKLGASQELAKKLWAVTQQIMDDKDPRDRSQVTVPGRT